MEFNWSHDAAACVCAIGASPVGIDVQSRVPFDAGLFERIATATERPLRNRFAQADDLSLLWSRKEALIKRTGLGMSASLTGVDTIGESSLVSFSSDEVAAVFSASIDGMSQSGFCHRARVRIAELRPDDTSPAADDLAVAPASDLAATPADDPSTSAAWRARPLAVTICSMPAG
ncbi:4'-phosphopantetheinyl transferase superfamily protein [Propionimicrobium sp. PCR01-08-3]|uniref:4'-phosphopantetheinyl transferase family protein n=1 Tax=Propionimicrobium sp. PCR01-08-3 TaxID=3052086 RepID=UPI00255C3C00|nr:4'-phosphopantetheinyl transferase superfamily protein [Propionimicrobium sp. PCR01-08-3]WIY83743.1 4'-phosphopantetheinyl transferase superfamily protein [Propionimicrobium sp. PCR01-08-3]